MERWAAVNVEDVHLATLRVYNDALGPGGRGPRIFLFLPPAPNTPNDPRRPTFASSTTLPTTSTEPDCYELDMVNDSVDNQIVVAERPKDASFNISDAPVTPSAPNSRARTTILTGRVKHECSLRPGFNENYRKQMRERHLKYNTPQRQIRIMEQEVGMTKSGINRLASGAGPSTSTFSDLVVCVSSTARFMPVDTCLRKQKPGVVERVPSVWLVCHATNFSTLYSNSFETLLGGLSRICASKHSNPQRFSRKRCQR